MANFHKHPGLEKISGQTIEVRGESITVGLWGYKDFGGNDLIVTNDGDELAILPAGVSGNSSLWKISVKTTVRTHKSSVHDRILAITNNWQMWDSFNVNFNFKTADAAELQVRPITADLFGPPTDNVWRGSKVPGIYLVTNTGLVPNQAPPRLDFSRSAAAKPVDFAVFAAKYGAVERAFVLMRQRGTRPKNLLVVIPHPFAQGRGIAYYGALGFFKNPLSIDLIRNVIDRFALERWGSQLLAASSDYALLMPVPAAVGGGGEIGPFVTANRVGYQLVYKLIGLTDGGFAADSVALVCFSGGVHNANLFAAAGGKGLKIGFACNQDPVSGTPITGSIPVRRQYISGYTTGGPRSGFIYLPDPPCWAADPLYARRKGELGGEYPHTWAIPNYTLYMALTSR
jgi:hypothetical protein